MAIGAVARRQAFDRDAGSLCTRDCSASSPADPRPVSSHARRYLVAASAAGIDTTACRARHRCARAAGRWTSAPVPAALLTNELEPVPV